jgi:serine/threonine protein phosphatase PrpC
MPTASETTTDVTRQPHQVRSFGLTDIGRVRKANEDQFLIAELRKTMRISQTSLSEPMRQRGEEQGHVFLVADGMGGHAAGEQASALAVAAIEQFTLNRLKWFLHPEGPDAQRVLADFQTALRQADTRIIEEQEQHPELKGMGTTLTLAYQLDWQLFVVHVGDSRAYVYRNQELHQLTQDHTVTADLVRRGELLPEEASRHRLRKVITNVVGGQEAGIQVEAQALDLQPGDRILLCSDGLTEMVSNDEIAATLAALDDPELACRTLVERANDAGGHDNVTVIVAAF